LSSNSAIKFFTVFFFILTLKLVFTDLVFSQEIEPRNYANIPKGFNAVALAYTYSTGDIVSDASLPLQDFYIKASTPVLAYVRTFSLFGCLSRIQYSLPYSFLAGDLTYRGIDTSGTRSGFTDSRLRFGINFLGSPALSPENFPKYKQGTILGASLVTSIPTGQYFPEKLINLGSNRWGFKPEVGVSTSIGRTFLEAYTGIWLYTNNNDYLISNSLSQNPLFSLQLHASYLFKNFMWVAANFAFANGGQTSLNGVKNNDYQSNSRIGLTYSTPLSRQLSARVQYHVAADTRRGSDYNIFVATFQYTWY
jgi:hypothetical protein